MAEKPLVCSVRRSGRHEIVSGFCSFRENSDELVCSVWRDAGIKVCK